MAWKRINPTEELKNDDCQTVHISGYTILEETFLFYVCNDLIEKNTIDSKKEKKYGKEFYDTCRPSPISSGAEYFGVPTAPVLVMIV